MEPSRLPQPEIDPIVHRSTRPGSSSRAQAAAVGSGVTIGPYRIIEWIGRGGEGDVFRVVHTKVDRAYALKVLRADAYASDPDAAGRFRNEARAAARIDHPNIVEVFDFGYLADGRPYLVMELVRGGSLASLLGDGPLEPDLAMDMVGQLASALAAAHEVGVIHSDVSPTNVLVDGGLAKLADFGLAQLRDDQSRPVPTEPPGYVLGTPSYIAPELIRGHPADERSDQYALGAVLFELLTGHPPFRASTIHGVCRKHLLAPVPALDAPLPLPAGLRRLVTRCLDKRPGHRFPSMRALGSALALAAGRQA